MMVVHSKQDAWNKVNEIFPTDYELDAFCSDRAGYPVYRSTADGHYYDYICDLGNSLEINLDSSKMPTVRVVITEDTEDTTEDTATIVASMYAARDIGRSIHPIYAPEQYTHIALAIDGNRRYTTDNNMLMVYDGLMRGATWLAGDIIASYCDAHGIPWGSIRGTSTYHYNHGDDGKNGGHFVIEGYVLLRDE